MRKKLIIFFAVIFMTLLPLALSIPAFVRAENEMKFDREFPFRSVGVESGVNKRLLIRLCVARNTDDIKTVYLFLPFSHETGDYRLKLPGKITLETENSRLKTGDPLPDYRQGEKYPIRLFNGSNPVSDSCDLVVYYSDPLPTVSMTTDSGSMDTILLDPLCTYKEVSDILVLDEEGKQDTYEYCELGGHGGSTWHQDKRSYEFKMIDEHPLLGMRKGAKWNLIGNGMDHSNLKNRIVYEAAKEMDTEFYVDCRFVNLYFNGVFEGLYLLTEKPNTYGGIVTLENDLQAENLSLNPEKEYLPVKREGDLGGQYYDLKNNPDNITGDYFLEFEMPVLFLTQEWEEAWFSTERKAITVKSPKFATKNELNYIEDYIGDTEKAIFAENGIDPESGTDFRERIDFHSWADSYLMMDFFAYQDDSDGSLFFYKKRDDPLLYSGPIWDYDKSMTDNFYDDVLFPWYGRAMISDWYARLDEYEDFHDRVTENYRNELSSAMDDILQKRLPEWMKQIESSVRMDEVKWSRGQGYEIRKGESVREWLIHRKDLFDSTWIRGESSPYEENIR